MKTMFESDLSFYRICLVFVFKHLRILRFLNAGYLFGLRSNSLKYGCYCWIIFLVLAVPCVNWAETAPVKINQAPIRRVQIDPTIGTWLQENVSLREYRLQLGEQGIKGSWKELLMGLNHADNRLDNDQYNLKDPIEKLDLFVPKKVLNKNLSPEDANRMAVIFEITTRGTWEEIATPEAKIVPVDSLKVLNKDFTEKAVLYPGKRILLWFDGFSQGKRPTIEPNPAPIPIPTEIPKGEENSTLSLPTFATVFKGILVSILAIVIAISGLAVYFGKTGKLHSEDDSKKGLILTALSKFVSTIKVLSTATRRNALAQETLEQKETELKTAQETLEQKETELKTAQETLEQKETELKTAQGTLEQKETLLETTEVAALELKNEWDEQLQQAKAAQEKAEQAEIAWRMRVDDMRGDLGRKERGQVAPVQQMSIQETAQQEENVREVKVPVSHHPYSPESYPIPTVLKDFDTKLDALRNHLFSRHVEDARAFFRGRYNERSLIDNIHELAFSPFRENLLTHEDFIQLDVARKLLDVRMKQIETINALQAEYAFVAEAPKVGDYIDSDSEEYDIVPVRDLDRKRDGRIFQVDRHLYKLKPVNGNGQEYVLQRGVLKCYRYVALDNSKHEKDTQYTPAVTIEEKPIAQKMDSNAEQVGNDVTFLRAQGEEQTGLSSSPSQMESGLQLPDNLTVPSENLSFVKEQSGVTETRAESKALSGLSLPLKIDFPNEMIPNSEIFFGYTASCIELRKKYLVVVSWRLKSGNYSEVREEANGKNGLINLRLTVPDSLVGDAVVATVRIETQDEPPILLAQGELKRTQPD